MSDFASPVNQDLLSDNHSRSTTYFPRTIQAVERSTEVQNEVENHGKILKNHSCLRFRTIRQLHHPTDHAATKSTNLTFNLKTGISRPLNKTKKTDAHRTVDELL
jgi:hypothetical protein